MPEASGVVIDVRGIRKNYQALRPLRVTRLELRAAESIALLGFDQAAAEVLVNLITGATLPDSGEVTTFGRPTSLIQDADAWLQSLDDFGIVSERAVVLDNMTVEDNLTMPVTMALHDVPEVLRARIRALANEVGLSADRLSQPAAVLTPLERLRLRLGRALGPGPRVLLAEHPNAALADSELTAFASDYSRIVSTRGVASLVLTANRQFAQATGSRILTLQPATGELKPDSPWRRWFS